MLTYNQKRCVVKLHVAESLGRIEPHAKMEALYSAGLLEDVTLYNVLSHTRAAMIARGEDLAKVKFFTMDNGMLTPCMKHDKRWILQLLEHEFYGLSYYEYIGNDLADDWCLFSDVLDSIKQQKYFIYDGEFVDLTLAFRRAS